MTKEKKYVHAYPALFCISSDFFDTDVKINVMVHFIYHKWNESHSEFCIVHIRDVIMDNIS